MIVVGLADTNDALGKPIWKSKRSSCGNGNCQLLGVRHAASCTTRI